jgi:hypothetical protein
MDKNGYTQPTLNNIKNELNKLINIANTNKNIQYKFVLFYSGHGTQSVDLNSDEIDGLDECIVPSNYRNGLIIDDWLNKNLVQKLHQNVKLTAIFDCCNSGTVLDLPYDKNLNKMQLIPDNINADVISLSGCKDNQLSVSAYNLDRERNWQGALTWSLLKAFQLYDNNHLNCNNILNKVINELKSNNFTQHPELYLSKNINTLSEKLFIE